MKELTVLMPCLNEAETLAICIRKAMQFINDHQVEGEVLIADNGSTDGSQRIAESEGARVINVFGRGYGAALMSGIREANGKYIIMGDADDSYDFSSLMPYMEKLREGYDLVMGNRYKGGILKSAMPPLHRYFGNPLLSFIGRLFFGSSIGDFNCGLRGFKSESVRNIGLVTTGMEFAMEMVVKFSINQYKITEIPVILFPDGRKRAPHLKTWHDGWRNLVFLLIYSPKWLFLIPSLVFLILSLTGMLFLLPGTLTFKKFSLDIHTLTLSGSFVVLAYQLMLFAVFVRVYSIQQGLFPPRKKHTLFLGKFSLERGIITGIILILAGVYLVIDLFVKWAEIDFGPIPDMSASFRILIPGLTLVSIGVQTVFASFFVKMLNMHGKQYDTYN